MTTRTYLELCGVVRSECNVSGSGPATVTGQTGILSQIVNWVADADIQVQSMWTDWLFLWREFETTLTIGTKAVPDLPSDVKQWNRKSFWLDYSTDSQQPLTFVPYDEWRTAYGSGTVSNSTPQAVTLRPDNALHLYPTPDAAQSFRAEYWARPARMTANADTSPIPAEFDRIIIARAKMMFASTYGADGLSEDPSSEFTVLLRLLQADQLPGQRQNTMAQFDGELVVRPD